ncbi:MAG: hypothetical protein JWR10_4782 [Rubritepida sp.]|nr:hypothetical protein [Rubritepida sp.]
MTHNLGGVRVLVAEDEILIAMELENALISSGCVVIGPYSRLSQALKAAQSEVFDVALLDVNLQGHKIFPVAETLASRALPFLLLTGYADRVLPRGGEHWQVLSKPYRVEKVLERMATLIGR